VEITSNRSPSLQPKHLPSNEQVKNNEKHTRYAYVNCKTKMVVFKAMFIPNIEITSKRCDKETVIQTHINCC
jgi:hypothetical protein